MTVDNFERILVLAPHPDDGELGCGATISRFIRSGCEVYYICFSIDERAKEIKQAMNELNLPLKNLIRLDYPIRTFQEHRQAILDDMVKLSEIWHPDGVFMPSWDDTHQDHQIIAQEGFRAFKGASVFGYEAPWNNIIFKTQAFIRVDERDMQRKKNAVLVYKSQNTRPYISEDYVMSLAKVRGTQINTQYAEAFEVIRWIL